MGLLLCCCRSDDESYQSQTNNQTPDREAMRRIQSEAIERRLKENEARGIKNPEHVKQQIARKQEVERLETQGRSQYRNDQIVSDWQH